MNNNKRVKNKAKYNTRSKQSDRSIFKEGEAFKGILITCNSKKEKFAVRDAYRIINDHIGKYRTEAAEKTEVDLDAHLESRLAGNTQDNDNNANGDKKPKREFISQQVQINGKGLVFIKLNEKLLKDSFDTEKFALEVIENSHSRHDKLSKDIFRFIPAEVACLASLGNFEKFMAELIARKMPQSNEDITWSFVYKCRNNNKFAKYEFYDLLEAMIPKNYRKIEYNGDFNIIVDITQHFMCLVATSHFSDTNKFSLLKKSEKEEGNDSDTENIADKHKQKSDNHKMNTEHQPVGVGNNEEKDDIDLF